MVNKTKIKEADMFEPLKKWLIEELGCEAVYGEVHDIDVLALCGPVDIIIEMKTTVSMKLLEQILSRLYYAQYAYICIPRAVANKLTHNSLAYKLAKDYGFGILSCSLVNRTGISPIVVEKKAKYHRHKGGSVLRHHIKAYHTETIGGGTSKEKNSAYQQTIHRIKVVLANLSRNGYGIKYGINNSWVSVDQILSEVETHYANPKASVMATLQESWNSDWCESKIINGKRMFKYVDKK